MISIDPPEYISNILLHLTESGHAAYLVGGCVRDAVMGRPVHDWDIATSATPVDVAMLFPRTVMTGERFGTVTIVLPEGTAEVTTFRAERDYKDGRHPTNVEFVATIDEDLTRRDFTMNAMAVSATGELVDLFGGIDDIAGGLVRCVGGPNTRFNEDALRMFRAYRFAAQLGFAIEKETLAAILANVDKARLIHADRIRVEIEKTLMSRHPELVGEVIKTGLLAKYMVATWNNPGKLEKIEALPVEPVMRWCALCAIMLQNQLITSALEFLHCLNHDAKTVKICTRALTIPQFPDDRTGIKYLLPKYGVDASRCAAATQDILQEAPAEEPFKHLSRIKEIIDSGECFSLNKLAVTGNDLITLGHSQGRELGVTLHRLLDHVIERPQDNKREVLLGMVEAECNKS